MKMFLLSMLILMTLTAGVIASSAGVNVTIQSASNDALDNGAAVIHGTVTNQEQLPLQGVQIRASGTRLMVNANEDGAFAISGLRAGKVSLIVTHLGYQTNVLEVALTEGRNDIAVILTPSDLTLEPVTVTSQQRSQQLLDIPSAITTLSGNLLESAQIQGMDHLADFVPGFNARVQTPHRPTFVIRGLASDEVSPAAQPRVSVYLNQAPVSRASMALTELYDMERVEVLKGPQGTLFGRGAQIGAVSFITRKPQRDLSGYIATGIGDFGSMELQGAVNVPAVENLMYIRISGIHNQRDGFVENTLGGTLNGKNTTGGRFSMLLTPSQRTKIDLMVNYQRDDNPGTAFMSKMFPNNEGETDIFQFRASLEQGEALHNKREVLGNTLNFRHYLNENNFVSTITSYFINSSNSRWDGDGTHAPAIDMAEGVKANQFTQDVRYNFTLNSHTSGFIGAGYWREDVRQTYWFGPNEQHMAYLFLQMPQMLIAPNGLAHPMPALPNIPQFGPLAGMLLPTHHEEENRANAVNQAFDLFADASWNLAPSLTLTAGVRAAYEHFRVGNESEWTGGSPSVLGNLAGNAPNIFFRPVGYEEVAEDYLSLTWRSNLKYDFNPNANVYAGYSKGRRPNVIQFNSAGEHEIMNQEILHSFDAGFKGVLNQRYWFDLALFTHLYQNFQTTAWDTMTLNYLIRDAGKATSFGIETNFRAAITRNISLFGNYAWINATFNEIDSQGNEQEYAGNSFRLTPEHSFGVGLDARLALTSALQLFFVPTYGWRSHVWFEDANTPGLEQEAYGLLNARLGVTFTKIGITLAATGHNLLNEKYVISAGNTGTMFGVPTYVPGAPRMMALNLSWKF